MSQKKPSPPQEQPSASSSDVGGRRKRPSFRNVVLEVMNFRKFSKYMEPLIRKVVKEEVESAMEKHMAAMNWDIENKKDSFAPRRLQLQFLSNLSLPVFTGTRIEGGDCNTLKVALIDACTGKTVPSGIGSSATVEIVVLEGDFDSIEGDNWTVDEFNSNIVRERQGKKSLLLGNVRLKLEQGIGLVGDLSFTDNSSWTRSRKFRLGARVLDNCDGDRVREAKSESFVVRDHRGELYKKHHPPMLEDDVWRLEKIGKDGAFHKKLASNDIKTVQEFLKLSVVNESKLRRILGLGMSDKMWEVTIKHARTCILVSKLYISRGPNHTIFLNPICQVVKAVINGDVFTGKDLATLNKVCIHKLVGEAYQTWDSLEIVDGLLNDTPRLTQGDMVDQYPRSQIMTVGMYGGHAYPIAQATDLAFVSTNDHIGVVGSTSFYTPVEAYNFSESSSEGEFAAHHNFIK